MLRKAMALLIPTRNAESDSSDFKARTEYLNKRAAKYGYNRVAASTINSIFEKVVQPMQLGFSPIRGRLLGRKVTDDIAHLIEFQAYKGGTYGLRWGISLVYVPHEWDLKIKWHRTLKSARFDLFETPSEYLVTEATPWIEVEALYANALYGETCFQEDLLRAWTKLQPVITTWFDSTRSLGGVLQISAEQMRRTWRGPSHFPDPVLVYIFTLARMGKVDEALDMLTNSLESVNISSHAEAQLIQAILEVANA